MPSKAEYDKDQESYRRQSRTYYAEHGKAKYGDLGREASRSYYRRNRETVLAKAKARRDADPVTARSRNRQQRVELRARVFALIGLACACCGESDAAFLTVDHIHGKGRKHVKERGTWGVLADVLNDRDARSKYQTLCANCNMAKHRYGVCPHQTAR